MSALAKNQQKQVFSKAISCTCDPQDLQPFGQCQCQIVSISQIEKSCDECPNNMSCAVEGGCYLRNKKENEQKGFNEVMSRVNLVVQKIEQLEKELQAIEYKIKNLTPYFSQHQIRVWRKNKRNIIERLEFFKGIREMQKNTNVKEIIKSSPAEYIQAQRARAKKA